MRCESCGADYKMKEIRCPFCQSENPVLAELRREETLREYDREAQRMENAVPDMAMKKWTRLLLTGCGILAGAAILVGFIMLLWGPLKARIDYQVHQRREQELEELLAQRDIEGICVYMSDSHFKSYQFRKFEEIRNVHVYYGFFRDYAELLESYRDELHRDASEEEKIREMAGELAHSLVTCGSQALQYCRQYSRDRIIRGNEELFKEYAQDIRSALEQLGVSPQLLEWMSLEQDNKQEDDRFQQTVNIVVDAYLCREWR